MFEDAMWRFGTSGTLLLFNGIADHVARRREHGHAKVAKPRWMRWLMFTSITAFYLLIGPTGGPLLGGLGNWAGVALAGLAMALRLGRLVAYPAIAGPALFYCALPIAVGVPWGLLALSAPVVAASIYRIRQADQRGRRALDPPADRRFRMLPGVW
jgi:hypothetical protein